MANFQKYPSGEKLSGGNLVVDGDSITIGLAGYKDFQGQDLDVLHEGSELSIFPGDVVGNIKLYKLVVSQGAKATKTSISDRIYATLRAGKTGTSSTSLSGFRRVRPPH